MAWEPLQKLPQQEGQLQQVYFLQQKKLQRVEALLQEMFRMWLFCEELVLKQFFSARFYVQPFWQEASLRTCIFSLEQAEE